MSKRQLSAIMFTDLAGYTAMMQEDEVHAKGLRDRHRIILEREISNQGGQILQYYGDGALSVFSSTISAASSAISIQKASITGKIPLRIGIHSGDVVIEKDGVYGDGVNIASRIESFATSGSIMISDKVFDDLKNHPSFSSTLMGEFELKNVKRPVEVYALTNDGLIIPQRTELKGKVKERIKSIAVLPFINRSADPENEYFSDGITEELITALARLEGLRVISRTSSFSFKGKNMDLRDIGKQLQVHSVLEGSVRKSGNKVRISAQLNSSFDGYELWSETYDRELKDIFDLQDEISFKIAQQLREKFVINSNDKKVERTINIDAYNHYLKGKYYFNKWTPSNAKKAVDSFKKATEIEPEYDDAYAGMADAYALMSFTGFIIPIEGYLLTEKAVKKALQINSQNESAQVSLGLVDFFLNWDFEKGKKQLDKGLSINPKSPDAHTAMAFYYMIINEMDEAVSSLQKAREIDPLSSQTNRTLADAYYLKGDYKMAIELYDWLLEQNPDFVAALDFKAWAYLMNGDHDKAIEIFTSFLDSETTHSIKPFVQLGYAYALKGQKNIAESYLSQLEREAEESPDGYQDISFATIYAGLGMVEESLDYLEKVVQQKMGAVLFIHLSPIWKPLEDHPRFLKMIEIIGLGSK